MEAMQLDVPTSTTGRCGKRRKLYAVAPGRRDGDRWRSDGKGRETEGLTAIDFDDERFSQMPPTSSGRFVRRKFNDAADEIVR